MPDIKAKDNNPRKNLPAAVPRTVLRIKDTAVKAKQKADETQDIKQRTPSEYATEKVAEKSRQSGQYVKLQVSRFAKKRLTKRKELVKSRQVQAEWDAKIQPDQNMDSASKSTEPPSHNGQKQNTDQLKKKKADSASTKKNAESVFSMSGDHNQDKRSPALSAGKKADTANASHVSEAFSPRVRYPEKKTIKQPDFAMKKTIKGRSDQSAVSGMGKSIKSAEKSAYTAIKTAEAAKRARTVAKNTAKASKRTAQASRKAAKNSAKGFKRIIKALKSSVKAIIDGIKWLVLAIAAGGWVAVLAILIIGMIGMIISSVFGIFYSGEVETDGMTIPSVIREINLDYLKKIDGIKQDNPHDEVVISGTRAPWKEILAVYAVKVNTDPDNPTEVMTMDKFKKIWLTEIFGDMNVLMHNTSEQEIKETITEKDDKGKETQKEIITKKKILHITVNSKTALEMAQEYNFDNNQMDMLNMLLDPEYDSLWNSVLYGTSSGSTDIVEVAASQIGNVGGQPYWSWYGFSSRVDWCACFVSWCANECGYIEAGIIPRFSGCTSGGMGWFKNHGQWQERGYEPMPGDIIFFDWDFTGDADHVGIVEYVENGRIHTIEGNSNDMCQRQSYSVNSPFIRGYGVLCP